MFDMMETALQVPFPFNMIIILGAMGILFAAAAIIATEMRKVKNHRADVELKQEMVARGMSADEIERVLKAGGGPGSSQV